MVSGSPNESLTSLALSATALRGSLVSGALFICGYMSFGRSYALAFLAGGGTDTRERSAGVMPKREHHCRHYFRCSKLFARICARHFADASMANLSNLHNTPGGAQSIRSAHAFASASSK